MGRRDCSQRKQVELLFKSTKPPVISCISNTPHCLVMKFSFCPQICTHSTRLFIFVFMVRADLFAQILERQGARVREMPTKAQHLSGRGARTCRAHALSLQPCAGALNTARTPHPTFSTCCEHAPLCVRRRSSL